MIQCVCQHDYLDALCYTATMPVLICSITTGGLPPTQFWTIAEMNLGLLCPCLVTLGPLIRSRYAGYHSHFRLVIRVPRIQLPRVAYNKIPQVPRK